jgi:hypothetical protein
VRALSHTASIGRHAVGAVFEALVIFGIVITIVLGVALATRTSPDASSVFGAKGGGGAGAGLTATIALVAEADARSALVESGVSYQVTRSVADNDPVMWATTKCYSASGNLRSWVDLPVQWGTTESLVGTAGPYSTEGARCHAYLTLRPWQSRVLGSASMWYDVAN